MTTKMWILGAVLATAFGDVTVAQTLRVPSGQISAPNVQLAPATAVDLAAVGARLTQLEAAHNTTRTELAQTRLELQQARAELNARRANLNSLRLATLTFAVCERRRQGSVVGSDYAWVECPSNNNTPTSNIGNVFQLQQATANPY